MSDKSTAISFLKQAEDGLRSLMEKALAEQRYADVSEVAPLADGLANLIAGVQGVTRTINRESTKRADNGSTASRSSESQSRGVASPKPSDYPQFRRDGDKLVKLGWSKKNREVYEHRAPYNVVVAFHQTVAANVTPRTPFSMDDILPIQTDEGDEIPSYQAYMALAWLREQKVIESMGRDGYALVNTDFDDSQLLAAWNEIPTR
ncbi:MAG: hypothetical protein Tsb009_13880 [Planctomycetaceae bacterium]